MYGKLLTVPYKFSKPKNPRGLYYELSHNVYYVRMMARRRLYNNLNLMSGVRLHEADANKISLRLRCS